MSSYLRNLHVKPRQEKKEKETKQLSLLSQDPLCACLKQCFAGWEQVRWPHTINKSSGITMCLWTNKHLSWHNALIYSCHRVALAYLLSVLDENEVVKSLFCIVLLYWPAKTSIIGILPKLTTHRNYLTLALKDSWLSSMRHIFLTHHFTIVGSIFYYCSIMYKTQNSAKQTIHHRVSSKRHLVTVNKVKEVSETKEVFLMCWLLPFQWNCHRLSCFTVSMKVLWHLIRKPFGSSYMPFPELFEVFAAQWNCINSSCEASEAFSFRIQKGVSFYLEIFWLTLCFSLKRERGATETPIRSPIWFKSTFKTSSLSTNCINNI